MKAKEFDAAFDRGEDITSALDLSKARRPNRTQKRVSVDFPVWMLASLDREANRLGVTRQSIIKVWLAERLAHVNSAGGDALGDGG
ncbi:MAG: CopG family transcriptional regulator [Gammaproteobacteria bacterium]|nr:CopG family transcriptional regulator [Gammaproteobacteria bacterium]